VSRTERGPETKIFNTRYDDVTNPRTGGEMRAVVLEASDWVNVVPVTPEGSIVAVRQYRFGVGEVTTEIPAGIVEEGENSGDAGARELLEETGYESDSWEYLGYVEPNPAFLDNRCHHWIARDAVKTCDPCLEGGEDIAVVVLDEQGLRREIREGRMRHSLAVSALAHVFDLREFLSPGGGKER
jgi:8-oxo-dGTP pyrophosphatase MutT (NUDIX family)